MQQTAQALNDIKLSREDTLGLAIAQGNGLRPDTQRTAQLDVSDLTCSRQLLGKIPTGDGQLKRALSGSANNVTRGAIHSIKLQRHQMSGLFLH